MNIKELPGNVLYIEDAFPLSKDFLKAIEDNDDNEQLYPVIPKWEEWIQVPSTKSRQAGLIKYIDWDYSINDQNHIWPRKNIESDFSIAHTQANSILMMIHEPLLKTLDIWAEKTGNKKIDLVTKNYCIKKYNPGGYIGEHSDRDHGYDYNTFDWTALIYLNDEYAGGKLIFTDLGYEIQPKAGSIIFFSTDEKHIASEVQSGNKAFMFFYIHSEFGFMHSVYETFAQIIHNIREIREKGWGNQLFGQ
jgi:Rps23 Pro-64 3,4-dihydroxylase Tpa1-like proline 4-hydroxylase